MWRWAELKRFKKETKLVVCFFFTHTKQRKYAFLYIGLMDTNRAAANFIAIAHNVVSPSQRLIRCFFELVNPLIVWRSKRMMHCSPSALICHFKHWSINNPKE